ncbi:MAG: Crp/Fnr family transcriptional regulator [Paraglaciecola sp.]|nr:Crp/Fnr family transcriptional regulator [Paraglaciecola sp.]
MHSKNIRQDMSFKAMRQAMDNYWPIPSSTWDAVCSICSHHEVIKGQQLYCAGEVPLSFAFVYQGLFRSYITNDQGKEYNKIFFDEGTFPGTMTALLTSTESKFTIQAIENSRVININFAAFRKLLKTDHALALFHIHYLEKNWLLAKDAREIQLVQENAEQRYTRFTLNHASICARIPQYHIASHLGITPTQLSRIRKKV